MSNNKKDNQQKVQPSTLIKPKGVSPPPDDIRKLRAKAKKPQPKIEEDPAPQTPSNSNPIFSTDIIDGDKLLDYRWNLLKDLLIREYPECCFCVGYGSGIIPQIGYDYAKVLPMMDLIFVVKDTVKFHEENKKLNPDHYHGHLWLFGSPFISLLEKNVFPAIFIPNVFIYEPVKEEESGKVEYVVQHEVKYAVVSEETFRRDLLTWNLLSFAGRMHKPTRIVEGKQGISPEMQDAINKNYQSAVYMSRLLSTNLPQQQDEREFQLLKTIIRLSYEGDIRMKLGAEDQEKVNKLLKGNLIKMQALYKPFWNRKVYPPDGWEGLSADETWANIKSINRKSSWLMPLNQGLADSPLRNIKYLWQKLKKGIFKK